MYDTLIKWLAENITFEQLRGFFNKRMNFVIVGPSGVGKSRIMQCLRDDLVGLSVSMPRTVDTDSKTVSLGGRKSNFVDTPGHYSAIKRRDTAIRNAMKQPRYGIIYVGAGGFHEATDVEPPVVTRGQVSQRWLTNRLEQELSDFLAVTEKALSLGDAEVFITIVNKADLWDEPWSEVRKLYQKATYSQLLASNGQHHEIVPYCAMTKKFWDRKELMPKWDTEDAKRSREHFLSIIGQF